MSRETQSGQGQLDVPLVVIEPGRSLTALKDFWDYRGLFYFLIWRDLKVRYKQAVLGVGWVVMQPLLMTAIFTVFFGMLARVPTGGLPYPLLAYSGLVAWTFFSTAVMGCSYSLVGNVNLITKVYFPRMLIPASSIGARLIDFLVAFAILVILILFYRWVLHYHVPITWRLALLPFMVFLLSLFSFGLGTLVACLNVRYRDVGVVLPVLMQLWMFVSPVVYPLSIVPPQWRMIYFLNPLAGLIEGFRSTLLGTEISMFGIGVSTIAIAMLLVISTVTFRRFERSFADII